MASYFGCTSKAIFVVPSGFRQACQFQLCLFGTDYLCRIQRNFFFENHQTKLLSYDIEIIGFTRWMNQFMMLFLPYKCLQPPTQLTSSVRAVYNQTQEISLSSLVVVVSSYRNYLLKQDFCASQVLSWSYSCPIDPVQLL